METERIIIGKQYKYKELCKILNEPTKGGKSKQLQLNNWKRFFRYNKEGTKFVIDEIFDTPKEKIDNRHNNGGNSTSNNKELPSLVKNVIDNEGDDFFITNTNLLFKCGIVSRTYRDYKNDKGRLADDSNIPLEYINVAYNVIDSYLRGYIKTALNKIDGILYYYQYVLVDDNNNIVVPNKEEYKQIEIISNTVMQSLNCNDYKQLLSRGLLSVYYYKVNKAILDNELLKEYNRIFMAYHIIKTDMYKPLVDTNDIQQLKFNKRFSDRVYKKIVSECSYVTIENVFTSIKDNHKLIKQLLSILLQL